MIARFDDPAKSRTIAYGFRDGEEHAAPRWRGFLPAALTPRDAAHCAASGWEKCPRKMWNKPPVEAADRNHPQWRIGCAASFNMTEPDIEAFMKEDWVMTCSDGSSGHPRKYGTFPRKLRHYVYERKAISLEFMVRHSAALTADTFKLKDRGYLRTGYFADVIVFDPKTVADVATYEEPERLATGMKFVFRQRPRGDRRWEVHGDARWNRRSAVEQ